MTDASRAVLHQAATQAPAAVRCDLILVSYNHLPFTQACVESLIRWTDPLEVAYRLLIIDNGSPPDVVEWLRTFQARHARVELMENAQNLGWVAAVNQGLRWSTAPLICWLNNDFVFTRGWLQAMVRVALSDPRIGLVNPSWRLHHETPEVFAERIASASAAEAAAYHEVGECNGACLLVRREVVERIGLLDEVYGSGGLDDSDFSRRAALAGFWCAQARGAFVYHWENVTSNTVDGYWVRERPEKRRIFEQRWGTPRQLAFIWDVEAPCEEFGGFLQLVRGLARLGLRVHLLLVGRRRPGCRCLRQLEDVERIPHANMRVRRYLLPRRTPRRLARRVAAWQALVLLASYRGKEAAKRFRAAIVPAASVVPFLRRTAWLHGVPVHQTVATCESIAREVRGWLAQSGRRETLAVVIITKNEERQIAECLQTVAWADQVVIVDDESTDRTVQLCREAGSRVVVRASHGDFDAQRNAGIECATTDWILQMDADERVPDALRVELELLLRQAPQEHGFEMLRHNWFFGQPIRYGGWNGWGLKLFRKAAGRYVGHSVHETLRVEGRIGRCATPIEHYPYQNLTQLIDRTNFYSSVEAQAMASRDPHPSPRRVAYHLTIRPAKIFWKIYVKRQAYREGFVGLLCSLIFSWSHWLTWAKYWSLTDVNGHEPEEAGPAGPAPFWRAFARHLPRHAGESPVTAHPGRPRRAARSASSAPVLPAASGSAQAGGQGPCAVPPASPSS